MKDYEASVELPFEFVKMRIPAGDRNILRIIYGSWSKPQMISTDHKDVLFDADKPYYEYL